MRVLQSPLPSRPLRPLERLNQHDPKAPARNPLIPTHHEVLLTDTKKRKSSGGSGRQPHHDGVRAGGHGMRAHVLEAGLLVHAG